jgi:hypothetical protein
MDKALGGYENHGAILVTRRCLETPFLPRHPLVHGEGAASWDADGTKRAEPGVGIAL